MDNEIKGLKYSFPDCIQEPVPCYPDMCLWKDQNSTAELSINYVDMAPDLPTIKDENALREWHRQELMMAGGAMIQANLIKVQNTPALASIFKFKQVPKGMSYVGFLSIPYQNCSFVLKVCCNERMEETGIRDAAILEQKLADGTVKFEEHETGSSVRVGWWHDPYDETLTQGFLMNLSEKEEYDAEFPDHPLSVVRRWMKQVPQLVKLQDLPKFDK